MDGTSMTITRSHVFAATGRGVVSRYAKKSGTDFHQRRYRALIRITVKVVARIHLGLLRASRGSLGHRLVGGSVVLLTTVGRTSGRQWTTPLAFIRHGDDLVVAASGGGSK